MPSDTSKSGIDHKDSINSLAFVDGGSGSHVEYDGPFAFTRDGGDAEVTIPVDPDDYAGIYETTAENLTDREGDLAVAVADGGLEVTGYIDAAVIEEGRLVVAIDDGNYADPSEIDIDPSEVDRDA